MAFRKVVVRGIRLAVVMLASIVAIAFLTVQVQQRLLRRRAERLSAEIQQIRLYQSTWADAQGIMERWGAWGHYDGSCTVTSCKYKIELDTLGYDNPVTPHHKWIDWLLIRDRLNLYQRLGGRAAGYLVSFTVHDGTIWRKGAWIGVVVSHRRIRKDNEWDRSISVGASSAQRLHETIKDSLLFVGPDEQLAQHPYYKAGRPGGCMVNCQIVDVYYSTHTPTAEVERITAFNFSCMTRWNSCEQIEDLLPAAKEWHVYEDAYGPTPEIKKSTLPPKPCDIPVWALARDARYVLSVEALSTEVTWKEQSQYDHEITKARVIGSLKVAAPWLSNSTVSAYPFYGNEYVSPPQEAEHLVPGKRYIVFPKGDDRRDQRVTKGSPLRLDRCGVQEDTPEIRHELELGFAQNDTLSP